jgi:flagellar motility protein MotE (MotC chaperone)
VIKKLFGVITAVLALNFLAVAGGVGYLVSTKQLDREKVQAIRTVIVGAPATAPATQPATQPITQESTEDAPMLRLDALLAKVARRPVTEQLDLVRAELDAQAATVERRRREVDDQRRQIATAREELRKDREALDTRQQLLESAAAEQAKLAGDAGFQKTLELYGTMPAKQVKSLLLSMDDDMVVRYLQAMDARQAGGVLKEFKTPQEITRAQAILDKMRRAQAKAD